jgi:hypothetical protein
MENAGEDQREEKGYGCASLPNARAKWKRKGHYSPIIGVLLTIHRDPEGAGLP